MPQYTIVFKKWHKNSQNSLYYDLRVETQEKKRNKGKKEGKKKEKKEKKREKKEKRRRRKEKRKRENPNTYRRAKSGTRSEAGGAKPRRSRG